MHFVLLNPTHSHLPLKFYWLQFTNRSLHPFLTTWTVFFLFISYTNLKLLSSLSSSSSSSCYVRHFHCCYCCCLWCILRRPANWQLFPFVGHVLPSVAALTDKMWSILCTRAGLQTQQWNRLLQLSPVSYSLPIQYLLLCCCVRYSFTHSQRRAATEAGRRMALMNMNSCVCVCARLYFYKQCTYRFI